MLIQPISIGYTNPNNYKTKNIPTFIPEVQKQSSSINQSYAPFLYSNISFEQKLNYCDFLHELHKIHKNKSIKNIVLSTINNKENYIGSGFNADVYSIPGIENYLIRIERKDFNPQRLLENPIIPELQNELAPNFGQYIASNNHGFFITKKVHGKSHSLPNWSEVIKDLETNKRELKYKEAELILNKIVNLSEFPQKSYDDLAKNIQKLNKHTDCEIDIMNPNNLIVDDENKTINIIDLWYKHSENGSVAPFNGVDSMVNLMLDPLTYDKVFNKLSFKLQDKLTESAQKVIDKTLIASEKYGLERNRENAKIIYKDIDKNLDIEFATPAYEKFLETFADKLA